MQKMLLLLLLLFGQQLAAQSLSLYEDLKRGPYTVGFQIQDKLDETRYFRPYWGKQNKEVLARPLQIAIWYPAKFNKEKKCSLEEYLLSASSLENRQFNKILNNYVLIDLYNQSHIDSTLFQKYLNYPLESQEGVQAAEGTFPLVLYAPGASMHWYDNFLLAEFLASHGYVVMACQSKSLGSPMMSMNWEGMESQTRDLEFMWGMAHEFDFIDTRRVNTVGRSWGAIAAALFGMRNKTTQSISSLDGTLSYNAMLLMENSPYPGGKYIKQAIYLAVGKNRPEGATPIDRKNYFEDVVFADAYQNEFDHMPHTSFSSFYLIFHYLANRNQDEEFKNRLIQGYHQYLKNQLGFLDHYNKGKNWTKSLMDGSTLRAKEASQQALPNYQDFTFVLQESGIQEAIKLYEYTAHQDSDYAQKDLFSASYLNAYAYKLKRLGLIKQSILSLEFAVSVFNANANLYDSLGEMYLLDGQKEKAIHNYRQSLKLNPENENARQIIEKLKG